MDRQKIITSYCSSFDRASNHVKRKITKCFVPDLVRLKRSMESCKTFLNFSIHIILFFYLSHIPIHNALLTLQKRAYDIPVRSQYRIQQKK
jgi:hypothetical protein